MIPQSEALVVQCVIGLVTDDYHSSYQQLSPSCSIPADIGPFNLMIWSVLFPQMRLSTEDLTMMVTELSDSGRVDLGTFLHMMELSCWY